MKYLQTSSGSNECTSTCICGSPVENKRLSGFHTGFYHLGGGGEGGDVDACKGCMCVGAPPIVAVEAIMT